MLEAARQAKMRRLMTTSPEQTYRSRIRECDAKLKRQKPIELALIAAKLFIIACGIFFMYLVAAASQDIYILLLGASILVFAVPAVVHEVFIRKRNFIQLIRTLNEMEIQALNYAYPDFANGQNFVDLDHPYSSDLDIFGPRSVFHFINRTATVFGSENLAHWLQNPPPDPVPEVPKSRQQAVQELSTRIELRQRILALGCQSQVSLPKPNAFPLLMQEPNLVMSNSLLIGAIHLFPLITLGAAGLMLAGLHWGFPLGLLILQSLFNRRTRKRIHRIHILASQNARIFRAYAQIIREIENAPFQSPLLNEMHDMLQAQDQPASRHIRALSRIAGFFEIRRSEILHPVLNGILLWDLHCVLRLERWKDSYAEKARGWLQVLGEFETLASFANLRFNFTDWVFPEIQAKPGIYQAECLGHFLIPPQERVCNDVRSEREGSIQVITGPNMAGKSTFLKTLGVNMVLGLAGAPICARSCRMSYFRLYTSMKVSDSLDKQMSLFYAELQRLKKILERIVSGEPVFYLLDEMLKGTNAMDRQAGALALLRQLVGYHSSGVVATHDIELTKLDDAFPEKIRNFHFDGYVEGDQLRFDYKLKPGKCESFNALVLMRKIGINI